MKKVTTILTMSVILIFIGLGTCGADRLKYNAPENKWEYTRPNDIIKYNVIENEWEYTQPDSTLKYNAPENEWKYVDPD